MGEVILDAFLDTLKVFPFVLVIYILIELLEHKTSFTHNHKLLQGKAAPALGAATGIIPQCGFSVMAAKLYDKKLISTGTVLAVFIATSDEALIILLSQGASAAAIMPLVLIKLAIGTGVGYLANLLLSHEKLNDSVLDEEMHAFVCGKNHEGESDLKIYLVHPLLHSLTVALYLFIVNLLFGSIFYAVGEAAVASTLIGGPWFQPFITAAVGLIPNCASSVIITESYVQGGVAFGSMVAGLCTNAGLGLVVLFKNTKQVKRNILLVVTLYGVGVLVGILINAVALALNMI